ncbi:MAG: helix-turn-helix domain-containing protein [Fimbriimonadaceae bacterium]|nr:helix-turn-helix transcriptional regulator [Chthonomonadaceae bacterium]MCO5296266.1 helix-turn-helix domain-containing protein [Fimbriimonadaceae bacterium]
MKQRIVLTEPQMEALADPLRSELVLALRAFGPGSVAELARRVAADPKSLYYPLRKLVATGLVRMVGKQRGKRRAETVYAVTADRFEIARGADLELRARLVKATLRAAEREFLAAQASVPSPKSLRIARAQLWLQPDDRDAFLARLTELEHEFGDRSEVGRGELIHWTSLVVPEPSGD